MQAHADVVCLALFLLEGHRRSVDTEDVAVRADELAPGRFSWKKYPEQINLEMVRVSLSDAKKAGNGRRVDGSGRTGWSLTEAGREWAVGAVGELKLEDLSKSRLDGRGGSIDERRWRRERARIVTLEAWQRWQQGEELTVRDAQEIFRLDVYTTGQILSQKISRLSLLMSRDEDVLPFLEEAAKLIDRSPNELEGGTE